MNIVLLDADVIIDLHRFGIWDQVTKANSIKISSIILRYEVDFYKDDRGFPHPIDLIKDVGIKFEEISLDAKTMGEFLAQLDRNMREGLHDGEIEALCLVKANREWLFCTSDKMAIKTIALIGAGSQGISFEHLLKLSGITKKLENKHTDKNFRECLREGSIMRIQAGIKK